MMLHHHSSIWYEILSDIAKEGEYRSGWEDAVTKSGKAGLFSRVVLSEKVPSSCKLPKRYRPTKESMDIDEKLKKRRLDFLKTKEDDEGVLFIDILLLLLVYSK